MNDSVVKLSLCLKGILGLSAAKKPSFMKYAHTNHHRDVTVESISNIKNV